MAMNPLPLVAGAWEATYRLIAEKVNTVIAIVGNLFNSYESTFQSGQIIYAGPNGSLQSNANFRLGLNLPNASGINSPGVFIGGAGQSQVVYITDEQLPGQKGITVIIEAGDASTSGAATDDGGDLLDFGGGSLNGNGGSRKVQGGTSVNKTAGDATLQGGNATGSAATAQCGNAVVSSGQVGKKVGVGVILSANTPPGATGTGVIRHQFGLASTVLCIDEYPDGSEFLYDIAGHPARGGFGLAGQAKVSGGPGAPTQWLTAFTGTITTAKLTAGGSNGSMTFASGFLISQTQAT